MNYENTVSNPFTHGARVGLGQVKRLFGEAIGVNGVEVACGIVLGSHGQLVSKL